MKAAIVKEFGPIAHVQYTDTPDPLPSSNEVVIDVKIAEVNFPDILVIEGDYQFKPPLPFSPGKTAAGIVSTVGSNVKHLKLGDRVVAQVEYGAYAEKLAAPSANCYLMPDAMTFETGAALGLVYQTSYFALKERARLRPGERVLVLGASGGIGAAACQLAKALGASQVIGGVRNNANLSSAKLLHCDQLIELDYDDLHGRLRKEIFSLTDGKGVDVILDPVGGEIFAAALRALAWRGRLVVIGFASGTIPKVKVNYLLLKNIEILGLQWSDYRDRDPKLVQRVQAEIFSLWKAGKLLPLITDTVPMAAFAKALERLKNGQTKGKILLAT